MGREKTLWIIGNRYFTVIKNLRCHANDTSSLIMVTIVISSFICLMFVLLMSIIYNNNTMIFHESSQSFINKGNGNITCGECKCLDSNVRSQAITRQ